MDRQTDRYRSSKIFLFFLPEEKGNPSPLLDTIFIIFVSRDSIDSRPFSVPLFSISRSNDGKFVLFSLFFFFFSFNKIEARKIHHSERAIIIDKYVCRRPAPHSKNNYFNCDFPSPPSFASLVQTLSRFSKLVSSMCSVGGRGTQLTCLKTRGKPAG